MSPEREQAFKDFLVRENVHVDLMTAGMNLLLGAALAFLLGRLYIRYGRSASDRRAFAGHFILITVTTSLIIVVVKSSLALSLGLVGALSIVRFRSAVREHEELAFLFICIALGLCLGADQIGLALLGFGIVSGILFVRGAFAEKIRHENLYVKVQGPAVGDQPLATITDVLADCCSAVKLKRCDVTDDVIEASFMVEFPSLDDLTRAQRTLKAKMSPMVMSVIDGEGMA